MAQKNDRPWRENVFAIPRKSTVLLVDEEREDLHYYGVVLQEHGYEVRGCESYEEGTRLLDSEPFDLIIVSQGSPKFEGRQVLERANQIDRHLPVVVVARCLDMRCYLEAMQLGAVDHLAEPVSVQELGRALDTHLRLSAAGALVGNMNVEAKVVYSTTRRSERKLVRLAVILLIEGEEIDPHALTVDLSQHGVRLQAKAPVTPGQFAEVIFEGDPNHAVHSRVVWAGRVNTDREAETGLEFINPIPAMP